MFWEVTWQYLIKLCTDQKDNNLIFLKVHVHKIIYVKSAQSKNVDIIQMSIN